MLEEREVASFIYFGLGDTPGSAHESRLALYSGFTPTEQRTVSRDRTQICRTEGKSPSRSTLSSPSGIFALEKYDTIVTFNVCFIYLLIGIGSTQRCVGASLGSYTAITPSGSQGTEWSCGDQTRACL